MGTIKRIIKHLFLGKTEDTGPESLCFDRTATINNIQHDTVNHPSHYTQGKIEVLDFILDQDLPYLPGQVIKYICRYRFKNGVEDLRKAEFYLKRLIKELTI